MRRTLWGLRVLTSSRVPQGEALVGNFPDNVVVFDRGQASVSVSDSDGDDLTHNRVKLLAEQRVLVAVVETSTVQVLGDAHYVNAS